MPLVSRTPGGSSRQGASASAVHVSGFSRGELGPVEIETAEKRPAPVSAKAAAPAAAAVSSCSGIAIDAHAIELRLRGAFAGQYDATLRVRDSLERPIVGGLMRLSRGTALLVQQPGSGMFLLRVQHTVVGWTSRS